MLTKSWLSCVGQRVAVLFVHISHIYCFLMLMKLILDTYEVLVFILLTNNFNYNLLNHIYVHLLVCAIFVTLDHYCYIQTCANFVTFIHDWYFLYFTNQIKQGNERATLDKQSCVITSTLFEMNSTCMRWCDLNFSCLSTSITSSEISSSKSYMADRVYISCLQTFIL